VTGPAPAERHLRPDGVREYLAAGVPTLVPIAGDPPVYLSIDPAQERLAVRVPWTGGELPDLGPYRHLTAETIVRDGERWGEVAVVGRDILIDAYPVLCAIADRVQERHLPLSIAVADVLGSYHELLRALGRLTDQEETGLFGELFVLDRLLTLLGENEAIGAWRGAHSEEHDFGLADDDVEVKTTTTEARRHWVGTLTQLEPTQARPLWVLSLQLTAAGVGGLTLPELIAGIRHKIVDGSVRHRLEACLADVRWSDTRASLYGRRFRLRSAPAAFRVDTDFPAITPTRLAKAGVAAEHVRAASYLIDLTGVAPSAPPTVLEPIIEGGSS
jgi:hypothetical protein